MIGYGNIQLDFTHRIGMQMERIEYGHRSWGEDLIYSPAREIMWVGSGYTKFFVSGKEICGARMYGSQIRIKRAGASVQPGKLDEAAARALNQLLSTHSNLRGTDATKMSSLDYIFGFDALNPHHDARGSGSIANIWVTDVWFRDGNLVAELRTNNAQNGIELMFTPENKLQKAIRVRSRPAKHQPPWLSR